MQPVKREVVSRCVASTDPKYGWDPYKRPIQELLEFGIVVVNKPKGPTSHMVADYVKEVTGRTKVGHGGTLDPGVTGVLPCALGRATRVVQALLLAGKEYVCMMRLHGDVEEEKLRAALTSYVGKITQMPPVRSAVKRVERVRSVYYVDILDIQGQYVLFRIGCQAGTYIRKFVHDFGKRIGVGAHMAQLIRTAAGPFTFEQSTTLQELEDAYVFATEGEEEMLRRIVHPFEEAVAHIPKIWIQDSAIDNLAHGARLHLPGVVRFETGFEEHDAVAILSLKNELIALGKAARSHLLMMEEKGVACFPHTVFVQPGTYPKS